MKAFTRIAVFFGLVLLALPAVADEPAAQDEADQEEAVFGADLFDDVRLAINHQAGTEFTIYAPDIVVDADREQSSEFRGEVGWPWGGTTSSWRLMIGDDLESSESFYVNDSWQMDEDWSFEGTEDADQAADDR